MQFVQTLLLSFAFFLGLQATAVASGPVASENGIEPIAAETFNSNPAGDEYNRVMKSDNKKGLGKFFSWVKKKSLKVAFSVSQALGIGKKGANDDNSTMWITLALWFFLGALAAHRWYRGKPVGWNILFILTAGGLGIWAIVDLINILTGNF